MIVLGEGHLARASGFLVSGFWRQYKRQSEEHLRSQARSGWGRGGEQKYQMLAKA